MVADAKSVPPSLEVDAARAAGFSLLLGAADVCSVVCARVSVGDVLGVRVLVVDVCVFVSCARAAGVIEAGVADVRSRWMTVISS